MSVLRGNMSKRRYKNYSQAYQNIIAESIRDARSASLPLVDGVDAPLSVQNRFCKPHERWTPFLVFTTLKMLPCSGILQAKQISVRLTEYSLLQEDGSVVPIEDSLVQQIFTDEELIRSRSRQNNNIGILEDDTLFACIRKCAFNDPYFKVVCELLCKPIEATFAQNGITDDHILLALEQFVNDAADDIPMAKKQRQSLLGTSSEAEQPAQISEQTDRCDADAVCMRVSIMLNDSALGEYFAAGFGATLEQMQQTSARLADEKNEAKRQCVEIDIVDVDQSAIDEPVIVRALDMSHRALVSRQIVHTCNSLEKLRADLPLRCSPTPVGLKNRIPRLLPAHGLMLDLYDYQRRSVFWMMSVEQRVLRKSSAVRVLAPSAVSFTALPMTFMKGTRDFQSGGLVFSDTQPQKTETLDVHGGILAAKTGSGKTTTTIALIYLQKVLDANAAQYKPATCGDVENLAPERSVPIWYPIQPESSNLYYVNCTLVVAPKQVVKQWADEFAKTISPAIMDGGKLRVHIINGVNDLRKLTVAEITRHIDVLIINKQIFASNAYRDVMVKPDGPGLRTSMSDYHTLCGKRANSTNEKDEKQVKTPWRISYTGGAEKSLLRYILYHNRNATQQDCKAWPAGSFFECLLLHSLHYRRIIIDEVHELDSSWSVIERAVASLSADVKWGLTATPGFDANNAFSFANDNNQRGGIVQTGYPALLSVARGAPSLSNHQTMWPRYYFAALNSVTSSDVGQFPRLHLHRVPVSLTPIETAIYCSISSNQTRRQLMFCSHHVLDDEEWQNLLHSANANSNGDGSNDWSISLAGSSAAQVAAAMQRSRVAKLQQQEQALTRLARQFDPIYNDRIGLLRVTFPIVDEICKLESFSRLAELDAVIRAIEKGTAYVERDKQEDKKKEEEEKNADEIASNVDPVTRAKQIDLNERLKKGDLENAMRQFAIQHHNTSLGKYKIATLRLLRDSRDTFINMERNVREAQRAYDCTKREYAFFDAVLRRVTHPDEELTCPICLDDGDAMSKTLILSSCGHELCEPCAKAHFARFKECPQCRAKLKVPDDLRRIERQNVPAESVTKDQKKDEKGQNDNANTYGSKLARMLILIEQLLARPDGNKIIIHSQFERLLRLTSSALKEFGIGHAYVGGSIQQCQNALDRFKKDPACTILLLSSESTISGVSLVEANHMIVLHPPLGNNEQESYATFWQAAGRMRRLTQTKECHMWSLVTSNTVEVDLYDSLMRYSKQLLMQDSAIIWDADQVRQQNLESDSRRSTFESMLDQVENNQVISVIDSSSSASTSPVAISDSSSSSSSKLFPKKAAKRKRTMPVDSYSEE